MKLSIWQQFSSNHSASYTVIGEFPSATDAQQAAKTVIKILQEIQNWYLEHNMQPQELSTPCPVEQHYGEVYGFDWQQPLDWVAFRFTPAIKLHERLLIIDPNFAETWQTGHQFVNLFTALGANAAHEVIEGVSPDGQENIWRHLGFEITCNIHNPDQAWQVKTELKTLFDKSKDSWKTCPTPWMVFHPQFHELTDCSPAEILEQEIAYIEDQQRWQAFVESQRDRPSKEIGDKYNDFISLPQKKWLLISRLKSDTRVYAAEVIVKGVNLILLNVTFADILLGLPAFMKYLEQSGGTNIHYRVVQLP